MGKNTHRIRKRRAKQTNEGKKRDRTKSCQRSKNKRARETSEKQKINRIRNAQCMRH